VDLDYENLPEFCTHCNMIGHSLHNCKRIQATDVEIVENDGKNKYKNKGNAEKIYVHKKDNRMQQGIEKEGTNKSNAAETKAVSNDNVNTNQMQ